jgi:SecD/SecF fusion protein
MQNKSAILIFTILLTLACVFHISYSFVTNSAEKKAEKQAAYQLDSILNSGAEFTEFGGIRYNLQNEEDKENLRVMLFENELRRIAHKPIYPLLGESYQECKKRELALGLDLQGGMSVTLEVSIDEFIYNLAGNTKNPTFIKAFANAKEKYKTSNEDFIDIFYNEFKAIDPNAKLASIYSLANKDMFSAKLTNDEVIAKLKQEKESAMSNIERIMSNRINKFGVSQPNIQRQTGSGRILIELPGVKDKERVRSLISATANLEFWETYQNHEVSDFLEQANMALSKALYPDFVPDDFDTTKNTSDSLKKEDNLAQNNPDDTTINTNPIAGSKDSADKNNDSTNNKLNNPLDEEKAAKQFPLFKYLKLAIIPSEQNEKQMIWQEGAMLGYCSVADTGKLASLLRHPAIEKLYDRGNKSKLRLMWSAKPYALEGDMANMFTLYAIKSSGDGKAPLDGSAISDARPDFGIDGKPEVIMQMKPEGAETWARLTEVNKGKFIAIVMDDQVYSAPKVNEKISGGRSNISGNFTIDEATDLANVLKSGTLPAKATIKEEYTVGPTLGKENIQSGLSSFIIALVVVLLYMFLYYNRGGLIANIALLANILFIVGTMASIPAILTLPGIAGIVLTIGMAVDANVLIFERIREELREGKGIKMAVAEGYKRALSSIIDSNVTTLLTAIILAVFGSGPVKGFAVTLIIGIASSLFSALLLSRLIITELLERKKNINFSNKLTENIMTNTSFNFLGKRKLYYAISGLIIAAGIVSLTTRGLDFGVEFSGGRTYKVKFENKADYEQLRKSLAKAFTDETGKSAGVEVKKIENDFNAQITTKFLVKDESKEADSLVDAKLKEGIAFMGKSEIKESRKVDPVISRELLLESFWAILFSLIIIFIYIIMRFGKWQFALGAVASLFHDVLMVLSVFSIFYGILPFSLEIDQAFIAAILTVVGYSINDTVVVFDRIREYLREHKRMETKNMLNLALNSTLSRTINTSLTTLIVLLIIFVFGGESIKGLTFALLVGIGVGTYSSLFVASPVVYDLTGGKLSETTKK